MTGLGCDDDTRPSARNHVTEFLQYQCGSVEINLENSFRVACEGETPAAWMRPKPRRGNGFVNKRMNRGA